MTTAEKIEAYLERALRYLDTPWGQRDPKELDAILSMKRDLYASLPNDNKQAEAEDGSVVINVHVSGLDAANKTAHDLVSTIQKARFLAGDLSDQLASMETEAHLRPHKS